MNNFDFYNPVKVVFGAGRTDELGKEANAFGRRALVVSYRENDFMADLLVRVCTKLEEAGITPIPFYEVVANPVMSAVKDGVQLCKEQDIDMVIAVGGGSVMDSTKIIAAGVKYDNDLWNMFNSRHDEQTHAEGPTEALPILMIPTLPATASEMNCGAVITNEETDEKSYVFASCIYPKVSILDPELLTTLPNYQSACGIADAISHVLEIYLNSEVDNPVQYRMMEGITRSLVEIGPQVLADPTNVELRATQQWASCVAWNGWTMPGMDGFFPMHAIGHSLSAFYDTAHGHTLAIMMPAFMRYIATTAPERIVRFAETALMICPEGETCYDRAIYAIEAFDVFLNSLGLSTTLAELDVPQSDLTKIMENATRIFSDKNGIINAVKPVCKNGVMTILETAYSRPA